jgi:Bacterial Ig domain
VTSTSHVYVQVSSDGIHYRILGYALPIHSAYVWDTSGYNSGLYSIRVQVERTTTWSTMFPVIIDHQAPSVTITHPAAGEALGSGVSVPTSSAAVVSGPTTLTADASDALSGIADVVWFLDLDASNPSASEPIGDGATISYNFDQVLGSHTLTAIATDKAGNIASATRAVTAVPGAIGPLQNLGVLPSDSGSPDPSPTPTPTPTPSESPGAVPNVPLPPLPTLPTLN